MHSLGRLSQVRWPTRSLWFLVAAASSVVLGLLAVGVAAALPDVPATFVVSTTTATTLLAWGRWRRDVALMVGVAVWASVVVVPWMARLVLGVWDVPMFGSVDPALPRTWHIHIAALVGVVAAAAVLAARRPSISATVRPPGPGGRLRTATLHRALPLAFAAFTVVLARELILPAFFVGWRGLAVNTAVGIAHVHTVFARTWAPRLLAGMTVAMVAVGAASRGTRFFALLAAVGWLFLLQQRDGRVTPHARGRVSGSRQGGGVRRAKFAVIILLGCVAIVGLGRMRSLDPSARSPVHDFVAAIDVLGATEKVEERFHLAGRLGGESYFELPALFLSAEDDKASADALFDDALDARAGFSAPLWFEGYLNFGHAGATAVGFFLTLAFGYLYRPVGAAGTRLRVVLARLTPALILLHYQAAFRLIVFAAVFLTGSYLLGVWLATAAKPLHRGNDEVRREPLRAS